MRLQYLVFVDAPPKILVAKCFLRICTVFKTNPFHLFAQCLPGRLAGFDVLIVETATEPEVYMTAKDLGQDGCLKTNQNFYRSIRVFSPGWD